MRNSIMKKRIMAFAASAVMSVSAVAGSVGMTAPMMTNNLINTFAADASVSISATVGYAEGMYATWGAVTGASGYNVYVDGVQIDSMLIRQYSGYMRADAVGLKAGSHTMKVVPVINGKEDTSKSSESTADVYAHDRSGYAFADGHMPGAYKADGTLKDNAIVVYVTNENKDTVTVALNAEGKGNVDCVGVQNIITGYKKGKETRPISIRLIGNIEDPANMDKGDIMLDTVTSAGMTIEGIGNDATANGWGIVLKNCVDVEVRNIAYMNCNSEEGDDCGLQQGDSYCWVHNCDFFYGDAGSDADQVKGDGALDTKKSHHITHSYNHFFDNGKCNLQGASASDTSNYITYHHNWYDHSDSRHPRVRVATVHVYNNYYDGNAKYGIGSTTDSDVFAENNYFRNCKYPILTAMQGSDLKYAEKPDKGSTFGGEAGGVVKAYGNYIEGQKDFITYSDDNTSYDAYVASSRDEKVPSSVTAKKGGATYNNFDTASDFYSYNVDAAEDVPSIVMAKAGRVDGGDFKWQFDNSVDDESYLVNDALKAALVAYDDSIVAIGSGFKEDVSNPPQVTTTATKAPTTTSAPTTAKPSVVTTAAPVTGAGVIYAAPNGSGDGKTMQTPTDVLSAIKSVTAGGTIYLLDGTYKFSEMILIDSNNNGSEGKYKTISAYPGANVVWDFSGQGAADGAKRGVTLDGDYWHFYGFEITKAADNGMLLSGNNNKIEMMVFNDNQDTGLQVSRYNTSAETIEDWPSYNLILNCTSKNNCDNASMENADGFAAKLTCGEGNVFDGCMAYNNSDDGWDLFAKSETGPIGVVTLKNCIAFRNGFTEFGEGYGDCDGNGFKLGGSGIGSAHVVENCLAFENLHCGFTDNNNPKLGSLTNCTSFNNNMEGKGKPNFSVYRCTDDGCDFKNMMSVYDASLVLSDSRLNASASNDKYVGTYENGIYYNSGYYQVTDKTAVKNGEKIGTKLSAGPAASDFISYAKAPVQGTDFHTAWRNTDGSIKTGGLYETASNSKYSSMGAHFASGSVIVTPPTSQTTVSTTKTPSQSTTTTAAPSTPVSGGYIHDFTANGKESTFYTITGNLATNKGTVTYDGKTLTQCLKMESATNITFNAAAGGKLTLVFAESAATVKVDGTKYTASGDGIITVDVAAGSHTITKADTANLFYIAYSESGTPSTSTTPTTPSGVTLLGDANCDGRLTIADATAIIQHMGNQDEYGLSEQGLLNADCCNPGDGVSGKDANSIQKIEAGLLSALPEIE